LLRCVCREPTLTSSYRNGGRSVGRSIVLSVCPAEWLLDGQTSAATRLEAKTFNKTLQTPSAVVAVSHADRQTTDGRRLRSTDRGHQSIILDSSDHYCRPKMFATSPVWVSRHYVLQSSPGDADHTSGGYSGWLVAGADS
jgi:hypothetical protein